MPADASDPRYDRPPGWPPVPVRRSLLLCSSPRSGSTLLADALHRSGRAACPTEYFDPTATFAVCSARWRTATMVDYVTALHRCRVSDDGLLSAKLHWYHLQWLCSELRTAVPVCEGPYALERAVVGYVFPGCRFVRVTRRDRDRQAVSWAIADQLNRWAYDDPRSTGTTADFHYSFRTVERFRRLLDAQEGQWDAFLSSVGADVLTVAYEDLVRAYWQTVAAVAAHAGVDLPSERVPPPRLQRQSDQHSERVHARYLRDRVRRRSRDATRSTVDPRPGRFGRGSA